MHAPHVQVPTALLHSRDLTPAAKLIWIVCHCDGVHGQRHAHTPTNLARRTELARSTVYKAIDQLESAYWCTRHRARTGKCRIQTRLPFKTSSSCVKIPVDLLEFRGSLSAQAIVCYGLLSTLAAKGWSGEFKWADLRAVTGLHLRTLKRAVRSLVAACWLSIQQTNRLAPIHFTFTHPDYVALLGTKARLSARPYLGQTLMEEYLNLLVDSRKFHDGGSEGILVNPLTGHQLQLDRYYYEYGVAFEFNGEQHYRPTERFTKDQVAAQRERDAIKRSICEAEGINLVVVHAQDLSKLGMLRKMKEAGVALNSMESRFTRRVRGSGSAGNSRGAGYARDTGNSREIEAVGDTGGVETSGESGKWLPGRRNLNLFRRTLRHLETAAARYRKKSTRKSTRTLSGSIMGRADQPDPIRSIRSI